MKDWMIITYLVVVISVPCGILLGNWIADYKDKDKVVLQESSEGWAHQQELGKRDNNNIEPTYGIHMQLNELNVLEATDKAYRAYAKEYNLGLNYYDICIEYGGEKYTFTYKEFLSLLGIFEVKREVL